MIHTITKLIEIGGKLYTLHLFCECHKIFRKLALSFDITKQISMALSESLNLLSCYEICTKVFHNIASSDRNKVVNNTYVHE